jgi:hypothetical protein
MHEQPQHDIEVRMMILQEEVIFNGEITTHFLVTGALQ